MKTKFLIITFIIALVFCMVACDKGQEENPSDVVDDDLITDVVLDADEINSLITAIPNIFTYNSKTSDTSGNMVTETILVKDGYNLKKEVSRSNMKYESMNGLQSRIVYSFAEDDSYNVRYDYVKTEDTYLLTKDYSGVTLIETITNNLIPLEYISSIVDKFTYEEGLYKLRTTNLPANYSGSDVVFDNFNVTLSTEENKLKEIFGDFSYQEKIIEWKLNAKTGEVVIPNNAPQFINAEQKVSLQQKLDIANYPVFTQTLNSSVSSLSMNQVVVRDNEKFKITMDMINEDDVYIFSNDDILVKHYEFDFDRRMYTLTNVTDGMDVSSFCINNITTFAFIKEFIDDFTYNNDAYNLNFENYSISIGNVNIDISSFNATFNIQDGNLVSIEGLMQSNGLPVSWELIIGEGRVIEPTYDVIGYVPEGTVVDLKIGEEYTIVLESEYQNYVFGLEHGNMDSITYSSSNNETKVNAMEPGRFVMFINEGDELYKRYIFNVSTKHLVPDKVLVGETFAIENHNIINRVTIDDTSMLSYYDGTFTSLKAGTTTFKIATQDIDGYYVEHTYTITISEE